MKKITLFIFTIIASLNSHAQWGDCDLINLSANGGSGNMYSFQVTSNVDSLVLGGTITPNVQHRWRAYSYNNMLDCINQSFDTSSTCNNCLWSSTLSQDTYTANFMDTLTIMLNMTILDSTTCVTIFGVAFDPLANNNSNGGFTMIDMNQPTGIQNLTSKQKVLYKTYNLLGQEINPDQVNNEIVIYLYTDGTSEKKYVSRIVD